MRDPPDMSTHDPGGQPFRLVVIAASVGGQKAISEILRGLPDSFALPIVFVQHLLPSSHSYLADILSRASRRAVIPVQQDQYIVARTVYVAIPDRHVEVQAMDRLRLTATPRVHFLRPAADVLFRTAAEVYGPSVIAVVLTGYGCDGTAGAKEVRDHGGYVIAQDEPSSDQFGMPRAAIASGAVQAVLPLRDIPVVLSHLASAAQARAALART